MPVGRYTECAVATSRFWDRKSGEGEEKGGKRQPVGRQATVQAKAKLKLRNITKR